MPNYSCDRVGFGGTTPTGNAVYEYIRAAELAVSSKGTADIRRSPRCPECGDIRGRADGKHILYMGMVIVGCKGYWIINPSKIGIPRPSWRAVNGEVKTTP